MKILPIALSLVLFLLSSCKEKKTEPKPHLSLDPEFKEYFVPDYGVGTKLIYEDTVNNLTEVVELLQKQKYSGSLHADYTSEGYRYYLTSNYVPDFYYHAEQHEDYSLFRIRITSGASMETYGIVKFNNGDWGYRDEISFIDSVELFGTVYYDVLECLRDGRPHEKIWVAKNVGIIAKFYPHNSLFLRKIE